MGIKIFHERRALICGITGGQSEGGVAWSCAAQVWELIVYTWKVRCAVVIMEIEIMLYFAMTTIYS